MVERYNDYLLKIGGVAGAVFQALAGRHALVWRKLE
jgi:hypothetical protein